MLYYHKLLNVYLQIKSKKEHFCMFLFILMNVLEFWIERSISIFYSDFNALTMSTYWCQVIPFSGDASGEDPPPDLASYLFESRIVYLGMSLVASVTELILAEFLYLQYEDEEKPIYFYINSTGTTKVKNGCSLSILSCIFYHLMYLISWSNVQLVVLEFSLL